MTTRPRIVLPALLAALAATGLQTAAFAGPAEARNASVSYAGLDLASAEGQRSLDARIARAVEQVCDDGSRSLAAMQRQRACEAETRAAVTVVRDQLVANAVAGASRQAARRQPAPAVD